MQQSSLPHYNAAAKVRAELTGRMALHPAVNEAITGKCGSSLFRVGKRLYANEEAEESLHPLRSNRVPDDSPAKRQPEPAPVPGPSAPPSERGARQRLPT